MTRKICTFFKNKRANKTYFKPKQQKMSYTYLASVNTNSYEKAALATNYYKLPEQTKITPPILQVANYVEDREKTKLREMCMAACDLNAVPVTLVHADCL